MGLPESWEKYRLRAEKALSFHRLKWSGPERLLEAMSYSLEAGGKRLRPALLLASFDACGASVSLDPAAAACAVEYVHTYSLIHDDLPAMDNDELRRGKPTSHVVFGEALAILAGDALLAEAFRTPAEAYAENPALLAALLRELAQAASSAGLVGGQVLDMQNNQRHEDRRRLETLHAMKTGALIRCAVRMGAILAGADENLLSALTRYAENIGLAFQITDDILDVTSSKAELGKSIGKDAQQLKLTFTELLGLDAARAEAAALVEAAQRELGSLGQPAASLREIAGFIIERRY